MDKQVQSGKIRYLGISIGSNDNIYQTELATEVNADVIQVVYNRLDQKPEEDVFPSCERQNLGVKGEPSADFRQRVLLLHY